MNRGAACGELHARGSRTAPSRGRRSSAPRASRRPATRAAPPRPARRSVTPSIGTKRDAWRLPSVMVPVLSSSSTETSPAASTARPLVASTFARTRRFMPAMPIADSSAPMVVGISATNSDASTASVMLDAGVVGHRHERRGHDHEHDRQAGEQDRQRDLVRRPLPDRALDEADHPVEERLARVRGDRDDDPVGEHAGAAGDARAVAAGLADHGRRLAGDGRLVDARDALDDLAVGRDHVAGLARRRGRRLRRSGAGVGHLVGRRRAGAPWWWCASCAARRPGPCRGPRRAPRRSSRTAPSARARSRSGSRRWCRPCPGRGRRSAGR